MKNGIFPGSIILGSVALACLAAVARPPGESVKMAPSRIEALDTTALDIEGRSHQPFRIEGDTRASVLLFVTHDCPISNAYSPEFRRLHRDYENKGFQFYLVYVDPDVTTSEILDHRKSYNHPPVPAIHDDRHLLVKATGASLTPEAVVVAKKGEILYRGRIDNLFPALGKRRRTPSVFDLRSALDSAILGRPVANPRTTAIGCYIPSLAENP